MKRLRDDDVGGGGGGGGDRLDMGSKKAKECGGESPSSHHQHTKRGAIDNPSIASQTKIIFQGCDDLISGFNRFLPEEYQISPEDNDEKIDGADRLKFGGKSEEALPHPATKSSDDESLSLSDKFVRLLYKARQVLGNADYMDLLKKVHDHRLRLISREDLEAALTHHPTILDFVRDNFEEEKKDIKPVSERLNLSKRISYSYWVLPEENRVATVGEVEEVGVLNSELVCMRDPEERDYSFKQKELQQHEQMLFKLEDDRYEIDLLQGNIKSAIDNVVELLKSIKEKRTKLDRDFKIEKHLSAMNVRCIERLYGDHGLEIMEVLNKKPVEALTVILKRLEKKKDELDAYKDEFNSICKKILSKKSVDTQKHQCQ